MRKPKTADNSRAAAPRPTGKPFAKGPDPRRNLKGAPVRGQSWQESIKRLTDMTGAELRQMVGDTTPLGKMLKELPQDLPVKDGLILASIIAYGRDPDPRMFTALTNREEGMPKQPVTLEGAISVEGLQAALKKAYGNTPDDPGN